MDLEAETRKQVDAARRTVLAVANSDRATLVVTGSDRVSWLNGLLTADLAKRKAADVTYGLVVGRSGRVLADAFVGADEARILLSVPASVAGTLRHHFDHYLVMEDAEMEPGVDAFESWALHGPGSDAALAAAVRAGAVGGGLNRTGLGGAFVFAPRERAANVGAALRRHLGETGGALSDDAGWNALRLERAVPRFGIDFDDKTYPQEAGLEKVAVSFDKGCYLGQEVVCMLELRGHVKRKLAALVIDGANPATPHSAVTDEAGVTVGEITSSAMSPTLGQPIALAMLKRGNTEPGTRLIVGGGVGGVVGGGEALAPSARNATVVVQPA